MPVQDALELLLPEADETRLRHARKVTTFLRLLANDARPAHASTVQVDFEAARGVLDEGDRRRLRGALEDLFAAYLAAAAGPGSFLVCAVHGESRAAWRVVEGFRDELKGLAELPGPGEAASSVASRLLDALARVDRAEAESEGEGSSGPAEARELERALGRARLELATGDPRAAERVARRVQSRARERLRARAPEACRRLERAALATLVEALLERGAVGAARAALEERSDRPEKDERLRRLEGWVRLVSGDFAGARRALVGLPPWSGSLPRALVELREHRPAWLSCLAGRAPSTDVEAGSEELASPDTTSTGRGRTDVGASVLAIFAFDPDRGAVPVVLEVAPALRERAEAWALEREDAHAIASAPEHRLVVTARPLVEHRSGESPLDGVLGGATRAVARWPVRSPAPPAALEDVPDGPRWSSLGEVAGWIHLELEHHLVPDRARLARIAERWRPFVLSAAASLARGTGHEREDVGAAPRPPASPAGCPAAEVFERLVAELGIKTTQRLWWAFELDGRAPRLVARGGGGGGFRDPDAPRRSHAASASRALERACLTGGAVRFEEPEPGISLHPDAASGVVVPLRLAVPERVRRGAVTTGVLVIESSRRRDFGAAELERFTRIAGGFALAHLCARYRAWSRARHGLDVRLDADEEVFRALADHLFAAARSRAPALVRGPRGAGKRVLARFLHFCGERADEPLVELTCGESAAERDALAEAWERAAGGTLLLAHVERLGEEAQVELARRLAPGRLRAARAVPRTLATIDVLSVDATAPTEGRALREDLAQRLAAVHVRAPSLAERREELPALATFLAERLAREEALPAPSLQDDALALLWRQPWPANVRELEALVHKLVLLHPGVHVGAAEVRALATHHGIELVHRTPSKRPDRATIVSALRTTRTAGGRANKTRAALYLGWDPDTLVARMGDLDVTGPEDLPAERS